MRKLLLLLALAAISTAAQTTQGNINAQSTDCTTTNSCVVVTLSSDAATAAVTVTGTFSATLKIEKSADNGTTWTSAGTDVTSTGVTTYSIPAMSHFRVRCSGYSSGTAVVKIRASPAINSAGFSGTPGGSNTQVQFNNSGAFGGSANLTWDGATLSVTGVAPVADITSNSGGSSLRWLNTYAQTGNFSAVKVGSGTLGDTANALIQLPNNSVMVSAKKNGSGSCDIGINTSNQFTFSCPGVFSGDMLTLPSVAGHPASPVNGALSNNTTTNKVEAYENSASLNIIGATSYSLGSSDTLTCSTIGAATETAFATTLTIPANLLQANRGFIVTWLVSVTSSATSSTWIMKQRLTNVAGTTIYSDTTGNPAGNSAAGLVYAFSTITMGTAAAGASVNTYTGPVVLPKGNGPTFTNGTAQPVAIPTNAAQVLVLTGTCNNNTAGNSMTLIGATLRPL